MPRRVVMDGVRYVRLCDHRHHLAANVHGDSNGRVHRSRNAGGSQAIGERLDGVGVALAQLRGVQAHVCRDVAFDSCRVVYNTAKPTTQHGDISDDTAGHITHG